jgi:restriction system protein
MSLNALDAVAIVLKDTGKPLDCRSITNQVLDRQLWFTTARVPEQSIHAYLAVDIKNRGAKSRFQRTAPGQFALRAWGLPEVASRTAKNGKQTESSPFQPEPQPERMSFTDAAELVLAQYGNGKSMHYRTITDKALELGLVATAGQTPAATLNAAIINEIARDQKRGDTPRFTKLDKGMVSLTDAAPKTDDNLAAKIERHNTNTKKRLHDRLFAVDPTEFEALIGRLLVALGFEDVEVTSKSGDGGIDVRGTLVVGDVIRTRMAVQAKRWKNNIQAPTVQQVRGSLGTHEQGLIISTGDFSAGAREEAQRSNAVPVALMNGAQLVNLLVEHEILTRKTQHVLVELGEDESLET